MPNNQDIGASMLSLSNKRLHLTHLLPVFCLLLFSSLSTAALINRTHKINIEQQALSSALIELGHQTNISVIFDKSITHEKHSKTIKGSYTLINAFNKLLVGSGLNYSFINDETVSIQVCEIDECIIDFSDEPEIENQESKPITHAYLDEVISIGHRITGSRIRRSDINGTSPVDILTLEDIEISGAQSISDVLKYLPAVAGNSTSTFVTNGGDGTSSVALRGLPTSNTLVLINGKRSAPGGTNDSAVDLNTIPFPAIERIEVLKEGASAIYGTDAIAGVVNVIMKNEYDGLNLEAYYGASDRSDLETSSIKFTFGQQYENGDLIISGNLFDQGEIYSRDRAISASADGSIQGGSDLRSSATPFPRITLGDNYLILEAGFDGTDPAHFRPIENDDRYNYREETYAYVPSQQQNLFIHGYYNLSEKTNLYIDTIYAETWAENKLAATPLTNFQGVDVTVASNNIYNPFGQSIVDFRRRMIEFNPRLFENTTVKRHVSFGIEQSGNVWSWDIGFNWSENDSQSLAQNLLYAERTQRALGDAMNCLGFDIDGCEPLNVFGPPDSIGTEQVNYLSTYNLVFGIGTLKEITANTVGSLSQLPAGPLKLAAGVDYREETISIEPDIHTQMVNTIGGAMKGSTRGERSISEFYLELLAPLYVHPSYNKGLELELAVRYSNYSDFGDISNPKVGIKYYAAENFMLRAVYSRGFRAPSMSELHSSEQQSFDRIQDPCALAENVGTLPACTQLSDITRSQFLTVKGGNENLFAEQSESYIAGLLWNSKTLPGFSTTMDIYLIEQRNVVDSSAQFVVDQNAQMGLFSDRVTRDQNGNLHEINATFLNIGRREILGADITFNYTSEESEQGKFKFALNASHIRRYLDQVDPSAEKTNLAGSYVDSAAEGNGALPKWKFNIGFSWTKNYWSIAYTAHHVDAVKETIPYTSQKRKIRSWTIHDTQISTFIPKWINTRLTFGMNNIFNKEPPFAASAFNDNIDARTYDLTGRFLYLKLSKEF